MRTYSVSLILFFSASLWITGCGSFVVDKVNYAHQLETVMIPDAEGQVTDQRHGIAFNVTPFAQEEWGEDTEQSINEIRMIRDDEGFYYITSAGFSNVYIMSPEKGKMKLKKKFKVSDSGLSEPAFNYRSDHIELVDLKNKSVQYITLNGVENMQEEDRS